MNVASNNVRGFGTDSNPAVFIESQMLTADTIKALVAAEKKIDVTTKIS